MLSKEVKLDINGLTIRAKMYGSNKMRKMLAIHGWLDNAGSFDKVAPLLSDQYHIVAVDLIGHGKSDHRGTTDMYHIWDYALELKYVIQKLGWTSCRIMAHSLGTGVASILTTLIPSVIEDIIFIDGLGLPFVTPEKELAHHFTKSLKHLNMARKTKLFGFSSPDMAQFDTVEEAIEDRKKGFVGVISGEAANLLVKRSLIEVNGKYRWSHDPKLVLPTPIQLSESQAQSFLSAITVQTIIILGSDGLFTNDLGQRRINCIRNSKVFQMGGGHHLHLEDADEEIAGVINKTF